MRIPTVLIVTSAFVFTGGCSGNNLGSGTGSNGTSDDSGTGTTTTADGGSGDSHAACDSYLKCVTDATPQTFPEALQAYGPNGTCWGSSASVAAECDSACTASMAQMAKNYPQIASCGSSFGSTPPSFPGVQANCDACMWSTCPADEAACLADSVCAGLYDCWAACPGGDETCGEPCQTQAALSSKAVEAIEDCMGSDACEQLCVPELQPNR